VTCTLFAARCDKKISIQQVTCVNTTYAKRCFKQNRVRQMILILEQFGKKYTKKIRDVFLKKILLPNLRGKPTRSFAMTLRLL